MCVLLVWGGDWCECVCYWCGVGTGVSVCATGEGWGLVSVCATGVGWGLV